MVHRGMQKSSSSSYNNPNLSYDIEPHESTKGLCDDCLSGQVKCTNFSLMFYVIFIVFILATFLTIFALPKHTAIIHEHPGIKNVHSTSFSPESGGNLIPPGAVQIKTLLTNKLPEASGNFLRKKEDTGTVFQNPPIKTEDHPIRVLEQKPVPVETKSSSKGPQGLGMDTALLIICANRANYLDRTLSHVIKYHPKQSVPIIISQDGDTPAVRSVIEKYQNEFKSISSVPFDHIYFHTTKFYENGYFRLADHFAFALNAVFDRNFQRVIILEEDLEIAPDFFEYFASLYHYLDNPENNLLAISAWNDNGFTNLVKDPRQVYRSDFFPGLGWMMTKALWVKELKSKWPKAYWDDWLREPKQRQGRHILRPEVCRTLHFGTHGVSNAQYSEYLQTIKLNDQFVRFTELNLDYLLESKWNSDYVDNHVKNAPEVTIETFNSFKMTHPDVKEVKIYYSSYEEGSHAPDSLGSLSRWSGIMNNVKAGVPRTAYKGIVSFWKDNIKVHAVYKKLGP